MSRTCRHISEAAQSKAQSYVSGDEPAEVINAEAHCPGRACTRSARHQTAECDADGSLPPNIRKAHAARGEPALQCAAAHEPGGSSVVDRRGAELSSSATVASRTLLVNSGSHTMIDWF